MQTVSLADITFEQGLGLVMLRKQAMDEGRIQRMTKEALDNSNLLTAIGDKATEKSAGIGSALTGGLIGNIASKFTNLDPAVKNTLMSGLVGTGVGAAAGLGSEYVSGRKKYKNGLLRGALAGGALGGGLGLMYNSGALANKAQKGVSALTAAPGVAPPSEAAGKATESILKTLPGEDSAQKIKDLDATANSWAPEAALAAKTTAIGAGGALGAKAILNRKSYDPGALADYMQSNASPAGPKGKQPSFNPTTVAEMTGKPGVVPKFNAMSSANRGNVELARLEQGWRGNYTRDHFVNRLERAGHGSSLFGGMSGKTEKTLGNLVRGKPDELKALLEAAKTKGLRNSMGKIRPGKAGLLGGLGLLGLTLGGSALGSYATNATERADASNLLRQLQQLQQAGTGE